MLKALQTQHREVARLKFAGFAPAEIATQVNLALTTVRGILADPICKAYIARLNDAADTEVISIRQRMINMNSKALDRLEDFLEPHSDAPPAVVASVAKDNLDRTGHQIVQKHEHMSIHLTKNDLEDIKKRAIEAGACIPEGEYITIKEEERL